MPILPPTPTSESTPPPAPQPQPIPSSPITNNPSSGFQPLNNNKETPPAFIPPSGSSLPIKTPTTGMPKILRIIIIVAVLLGLVIGAISIAKLLGGKKNGGGGKTITLNYWGLWEPENVMQGIISDYESSHPGVKVSYQRQSQKDYRDRLQNALSSDKGPDIFRFHNTWTPMFKNYLSALPQNIMDNSTFEKTFYPVTTTDLKLNGKYIGFPLGIDTLLLYYNEDLLRAAGKTPPETWDELLKTAQDLTVRNGDKIETAGVALGNSTNIDHWPDILTLLMLQNGTDMKNPGSTIGSDGKNLGADALTFYTLFYKTYKLWDETFPNSTQAFASGKLALYFGPSWEAFEFAKNSNLHFATVATPKLADVETYYATYWADGVSEKSTHQKEAWDFLKFLTQKDNMQKLYEAQGKTRLFGEPPPRIDMADQFGATPIVSTVLKSANKATSWYMSSATWDGDSGLNSRLIKYFADAVTAVNKNTKAEEALKTVDQGVAQLYQQYGIK